MWNIYSDITTQGATVLETNTVPESNFTITQGTLTIGEYANSVPYSSKLDNLSAHPVREIINKVLKNDALKAFDNAAYAQFDATKLLVVATATLVTTFYTNGTCTATNSYGLEKEAFADMIDWMKERNIPAYSGDDYMAIAHPSTFRDLKASLEGVFQYTVPGFTRIVNGEIGKYENCRFVEQTHIAKEAWSILKSNQLHVFGGDTVAEAIAVPEEVRGGSCPAVQ